MRIGKKQLRTLQGLGLCMALATSGCANDVGNSSDDVVDVLHTEVERQAIGNCWLFSHAAWIESMNYSATGKPFDVSQTYWTYWDWFNKLTSGSTNGNEIQTAGTYLRANNIVSQRGLMAEQDFIKGDAKGEMSPVQLAAMERLNKELRKGRLKDPSKRKDRALVRAVLDDAYKLSSSVRNQMTQAFGQTFEKNFSDSTAVSDGTAIISAKSFPVWFTERNAEKATTKEVKTTLDVAMQKWRETYYPATGDASFRRSFQIRIQRALHDRQPVVVTWSVDFNAMESSDKELMGSFNLKTLTAAGPGRQGGHISVFEDYEVVTKEFGVLKAGETLDPSDSVDSKKLAAALLPSSTIRFFRIKNSWGAFRDDRSSAPGFPGYHDLYMDYLDSSIKWCPSLSSPKDPKKCLSKTVPLMAVTLPPGY